MTEPKLTLNLRSPTTPANDALSKAGAKKRAHSETMDEAWARILAMKNSETDGARLAQVRAAMDAGKIGREPDNASKRFSKAEALRLYAVLAEQQREGKLADMVANTPDNYVLITTESELRYVRNLLRRETVIAVDTETTGVDVYTDIIVGMSITLPKADVHVYIPFEHNGVGEQLDRAYVMSALSDVMLDENIGKVFHNAIFDIAMFRRHGFDIKGVHWDTMTAMHLLNENEMSFKLKDLAPKYLGVGSDTFGELFGKTLFSDIPLDIALVYAAKDTHLTYDLFRFQYEHMAKMPTILEYYFDVEVPILTVIVDLEANGYVLDLGFAKEYGGKLHARAEELRVKLLAELTPHHEGLETLNLNSPQQMILAMSSYLGVKLANMDAKKTLKPLSGKHPIIADLLEYRKVVKMSGTYIDTLPTKRNPTTHKWHSRYNPMGTVTGRFSSGKDEEDTSGQGFNVQNIPGDARPMFRASAGKVLVGADFKAQEIRCVAYMSGEPVLIDAFLTERDPYAMMASTFYKRPYEEVFKNPDGSDTKERKQMKVVWLATLYGMSDYSLADMLGVDKKEATSFKADLFGSMPVLSAWLANNNDYASKTGFVWADKQARKRRLPDAKKKRKQIPYGKWSDPKYDDQRKHNSSISRALRQATNARVQGSSSIQTKVTMIRAHEYCANKPGWALWGSIHDELLFEVPEDFTQEEARDIERLMTESYRWGDVVPNGSDLEVMRKWGEGVSVADWFANKSA
ncbi:DNA polymerase I [Sporosarcina phage Lietuvens]|nr:DNA polymerase I [Sporosarcina phage Lietuvens]